MKLHRRAMAVAAASADLRMDAIRFARERDLSHIEMATILGELQQRFVTLALRHERHPDDPTRKADEE